MMKIFGDLTEKVTEDFFSTKISIPINTEEYIESLGVVVSLCLDALVLILVNFQLAKSISKSLS
jgi:hypothetical protein